MDINKFGINKFGDNDKYKLGFKYDLRVYLSTRNSIRVTYDSYEGSREIDETYFRCPVDMDGVPLVPGDVIVDENNIDIYTVFAVTRKNQHNYVIVESNDPSNSDDFNLKVLFANEVYHYDNRYDHDYFRGEFFF